MTGRAAMIALALALLAGCTRDASPGDWPSTDPYGVTTTTLPAPPDTKIDLFFMLDNSCDMEPKTSSLIGRSFYPLPAA